MQEPTISFPKRFLVGCATAAHQVEGGQHNDWSEWEKGKGRIKDGSVSGNACDNWNLFREDAALMASLHQNAHRFSLEWSRIEPEEGKFNSAAIQHYGDVLGALKQHSIEPLVTLHHFTLPCWLADRGGLLCRDAPKLFARYARACEESFGSEIKYWLTVNEPNILTMISYATGEWPPGQRNPIAVARAQRGLFEMHAGAAGEIRRGATNHGWEAQVSFADHVRPVVPTPPSRLNRAISKPQDFMFNQPFLQGCLTGKAGFPIGLGKDFPDARIDYYAMNFYCESLMKFDLRKPNALFSSEVKNPSVPYSTYGWPIDPGALKRVLLRRHRETGGLPIFITENGVADSNDELRRNFILDNLTAVYEAMDEGADVRSYMYWTLKDNFEWAEGYGQKFGITTREGALKPSARTYSEFARTRTITPELRAGLA